MIKNFLADKKNPESFRSLKLRMKRDHHQLKDDIDLIEKALERIREKAEINRES
jgi:hypothetical protein